MSLDGYHSILVLGGIRSGKSEFAESLVTGAAEVRYVATATPATDDPEWGARLEAHRRRRPATWTTEETGASPGRLAALLLDAKPDQTLLIDDLGGWLTAVLEEGEWSAGADREPVAELVGAVRDCAGRVVIVSPEVGMSVIPATDSGRAFADAVGSANRLLAQACDGVVLVVAGQPGWLKPAPAVPAAPAGVTQAGTTQAGVTQAGTAQAGLAAAGAVPPAGILPAETGVPAEPALTGAPTEPVTATPAETASAETGPATPARPAVPSDSLSGSILTLKDQPQGVVVELDVPLPLPDEAAVTAAEERIAALTIAGPGLGNLTRAVTFAAGAQGTASPRPFASVRVLLVHGDHTGGVAAGDSPEDWAARVRQARQGAGPLGLLATGAGARLDVVDLGGEDRTPVAGPIEDGLAVTPTRVDAALREGLRLADAAIDEGTDLIVLAAAGAGQQAAAAAVVAANVTAGPASLLPRVYQPGGKIDDDAWMVRCGAVRDALRGMRGQSRDARAVLAALAGEDIAVATGIIVAASARRVPVLIDGPVGIAAALTARDISAVIRYWTLLAEHGNHPTVKAGAEMLGATPLLDLRFGLGEGVAALAALPLIQSTLSIVDGV